MKLTSLACAAALALTAGAAAAQPGPGPDRAPGPRAEAHHGMRPDPAQMAQKRAEHLRAVLQLRPDQDGALQAFVAALQPSPGARDHMRRPDRAAPLSTPERLDRMQARLAEHEARFRARAEATKRFYAQLTPTQQRAFDALHAGRGMGRHMKGAHGMGGFGHGHGRGG
jgi:hypothetical protein